jgi:RsiW-degrading membrane proteinase PrsW (M82 family)
MEFKKLEIEPEGSWIKRTVSKPHFKKSLIYIFAGAVLGFLFFYITEGMQMDEMPVNDVLQSILIGAFFGFFLTNSPCARGRC